jgi:Biotin carboxylase, N-terminal domain
MIQSLLIANRGEIACRIIRTAQILPGTGRGTMRSMVEGQGRIAGGDEAAHTFGLPLHHPSTGSGWSPSPNGGGTA